MIVQRSVHVAAPIDQVFSLLADPRRRAELNPTATPIAVEVEDGEPLHEGSRCHYRLQVGRNIVDYHTRVAVLEPNRRIVSIAEGEVPIKIEVATTPEEDGTHLAQSEAFEPTAAMLENALPERREGVRAFIARLLPWLDGDSALERRTRQEQALRDMLEANLLRWLEAIKSHLEQMQRDRGVQEGRG